MYLHAFIALLKWTTKISIASKNYECFLLQSDKYSIYHLIPENIITLETLMEKVN